jgi:two-component system osmolarity sensor histidine kinase EnvZ
VAALKEDIVDMEHMLDEYLQFARGEGGEAAVATDLRMLLRDAAEAARRAEGADADTVSFDEGERVVLTVKRNALKRCVANLIDNALKYGDRAKITLERSERSVEINVDDDGPGIPEARREEAFRPFHRLDEGRNLQIGGVGLGLAIARDIARAHGGDLVLCDSPLGGLRATLRLPV